MGAGSRALWPRVGGWARGCFEWSEEWVVREAVLCLSHCSWSVFVLLGRRLFESSNSV